MRIQPNPPDLDRLFTEPSLERTVETHISRLYLCGDRVYKLKRAVQLPYVDFSTLAKRHEAARQELALNRRTAPALYLGLRAVLRDGQGRLHMAPRDVEPGDAIEWLVEMRRFKDDATLDRQLAAGTLTPALIEATAEAIAGFHATLPPLEDDALRAVRRVAAMNNESFARLAPEVLPDSAVADLRQETEAALSRLALPLARRSAEGRVRHGHGDLHLRNICLLDGKPVLFDCLEFDAALARTDTAYDIAFLLMDLLAHNRVDLANRALNRYLEQSGDDGALPLLPLYISLRAAIRAHVTGLQPKQWPEARRYLALARRVLRPATPVLLAIGGRSGTGKTTLARALAPRFDAVCGAVVLRSDVLRKRLAGVAPATRLSPESYTPQASMRVYAAMLEHARQLLTAGVPVILDAVFGKQSEREAAARLALHCNAVFRGLWLDGGTDLLCQRVAARRGDASDATPDVVRFQADVIEPPADWLHLNAEHGSGDLAAQAAARLNLD
ncbi:AAA family ATPase [Ferrovibrio sp.]|uniref:bifunctional aminoglycoside phosphotransferase/ATP-binding protein n=1 Tax=Ferrovibrio sp. TaxID=1917215 RepID=UPI003D10EF4A